MIIDDIIEKEKIVVTEDEIREELKKHGIGVRDANYPVFSEEAHHNLLREKVFNLVESLATFHYENLSSPPSR